MTSNNDERLKKYADPARRSRAMEDRAVTESRELSDDDRVQMFRDAFYQSALPDLPPIPGYHVCWLSSTNPRDSIQGRFRLGYEPVTPDEVPGWEYATLKTGEYAGMIGVNEMIAAKLPMRLYARLMREAHHDAPQREEGRIAQTLDDMASRAKGSKSRMIEEDGMSDLRDSPAEPIFNLDR
jgi:hypothetical protein